MKRFAIISLTGTVTNVIVAEDDYAPQGIVARESDTAQIGWRLVNDILVPPTEATGSIQDLTELARAVRDLHLIAGVRLQSGLIAPTDRDSRADVAQAIQSLDQGIIVAPVTWKINGQFTQLNRSDLVALAAEMAGHVQKAFDTENTVRGEVASGQITTRTGLKARFDALMAA